MLDDPDTNELQGLVEGTEEVDADVATEDQGATSVQSESSDRSNPFNPLSDELVERLYADPASAIPELKGVLAEQERQRTKAINKKFKSASSYKAKAEELENKLTTFGNQLHALSERNPDMYTRLVSELSGGGATPASKPKIKTEADLMKTLKDFKEELTSNLEGKYAEKVANDDLDKFKIKAGSPLRQKALNLMLNGGMGAKEAIIAADPEQYEKAIKQKYARSKAGGDRSTTGFRTPLNKQKKMDFDDSFFDAVNKASAE